MVKNLSVPKVLLLLVVLLIFICFVVEAVKFIVG